MKKNISETISKLEKLYFEIPDDFALQNAKTFCRKAINEMKSIQVKREKREIATQQNSSNYVYTDTETAKIALRELDRLIALENKKLDKEEKSNNNQFLIG